jgi:hypothetical protein
MTPSFRHLARESVGRARAELASGDRARLKFAALELRMAIESVTYERAQSYRDEIPQAEYRTWQPKKVMQLLIDIEPHADKGSSIAYGIEVVPGVAAKEMTSLGAEQVFGLHAIKAHYDALGSYLHMPTLKQLEEVGEPDLARLHDRCLTIIGLLDGVLSSPVFNINFGTFSSIVCVNPDCGKPVRRRLPAGQDALASNCLECGMSYELTVAAEGQCVWRPVLEEVPCPGASCEVVFKVSPGELKPGRRLACRKCEGRFMIGLALFSDEPTAAADSRPAAEGAQ